jgi:hypothetical protein
VALRHFLLAVAGAAAFSCSAHAQVAVPNFKNSAGLPQSAQGIVSIGGGSIATGQVSVGTTPVLLVAARARQTVDVTVDGAVKCYVGPSAVTAVTGFPLQAVAGAAKTIPTSAAVWMVCASTVNVGYMEHF